MSTIELFDIEQVANQETRVLVMWYPDWPVLAAAPDVDLHHEPVAISDNGKVLACSAFARAHGVRRGMRKREAQSRVPSIQWLAYQPEGDVRAFEPLLKAMEDICPGVELIRPGMCATNAKGPARYFGSEEAFIDALGEHLESIGFPDAQFGIADGEFAAVQAARRNLVVPPGAAATFLAPLSIRTLERPELSELLQRMGIRTLGDFASLPSRQVSARFGTDGTLAHRQAAGRERRRLAVRNPPPELRLHVELDQPLDRVDTIAFTMRAHADSFIELLAAHDLVATTIEVVLLDEERAKSQRVWRHPQWFTSADVVDRVRWQVQAATPTAGAAVALGIDGGGMLQGAVTTIKVVPLSVDRIGVHADGIWGGKTLDEKVHRAFTRIQSMLDHTAVLTAVRNGGRSPREFCALTPWGQSLTPPRDPLAPWPGRLPDPAPAQILNDPISVVVRGDAAIISVSDRGFLSETPRSIEFRDRATERILAWAGPWHSDERWWDLAASLQLHRLQAVTNHSAYLLVRSASGWWIEGIYD